MRYLVAVAGAALYALSAAALAADLTNIDVEQPLMAADGKKQMDGCFDPPKCADMRPWTLGNVAVEALSANDPDLRGGEKAKAGNLAMKIAGGGKISLTLAEAALVIKQVDKFYPPVAVARVTAILDPGAKSAP